MELLGIDREEMNLSLSVSILSCFGSVDNCGFDNDKEEEELENEEKSGAILEANES